MQQFLLWLLAAVPVVIMPGLSFYFDVIPRLVLLLMVVSAIILTRATIFSDSTLGRWFCAAAGVYILSLIVSSLLSANPALSLSGSTWRRFGLITQVALTLLAVVLAADLASRRGNILLLMRAFSTFGFAAAIYGIFQYFGKDPFLDSSQYHVGEGVWTIVRPPGTAGHADYFAVYLLMVAFCAWALVLSESRRGWRRFGALTVPFAAMALILTGTRGALVGAAAGAVVVAVLMRRRLSRKHAAGAVLISIGITGFYFSPAGERLRARVRWSAEDAYGGARLWLWRDSLRMAKQRPLTGFGPETYGSEFPHFQSVALARAYPDFHHESPHNLELDVLVGQGLIGMGAFAAMLIVAAAAALRAREEHQNLATLLLGCLTALIIGQQFCSATVVTALCVSVTVACLVALRGETLPRARGSETVIAKGSRLACIGLALLFAGYALRLSVADWSLNQTRRSFASKNISDAASHYQRAARWLPGASADLYYSRRMAESAATATDPSLALQAWQQAMAAGQKAVTSSDEPANAAYNLASVYAAANDAARTEDSLRAAISKAPNWFKPHWMLARLLALRGRWEEAEVSAAAAYERNGNVNPEVLQTVQEIRQKRSMSR